MLSPSKSRDALPATGSNYMSSSQLADYLTDLRAARAARVNSARTETSPTRSVRRQSPTRTDSRPILGTLTNDDDVSVLERRREQEEGQSLRLALQKIDILDEKSTCEDARTETIEITLDDQSKRPPATMKQSSDVMPSPITSGSPLITPQPETPRRPEHIHFATPQTEKQEPSVESESPQTYTKTFKKKGYQGLARAVAADLANSRRRISSGTKRRASASKHVFPNAQEKIYEEPIENEVRQDKIDPVPDIPRHIRKNPFARVKFTQDRAAHANSDSAVPTQKTLLKKKSFTFLNGTPQKRTPPQANTEASKQPEVVHEPSVDDETRRDSADVRGDGNQATKKNESGERTTNPAQNVNRTIAQRPRNGQTADLPIIMKRDGQSRSSSRNQSHIHPAMRTPSYPQIRVPSLPAIAVPGDIPNFEHDRSPAPMTDAANMVIPSISFPDDEDNMSSQTLPGGGHNMNVAENSQATPPTIPIINVPGDTENVQEHPSKTAATHPKRPTIQHAATLPILNDSKPQLPARSAARNSTLCSQCALPISGRVLSAAGERLHPECFKCHQCNTNLECVAFYPEPDQKYYERIARVQQRLAGLQVSMPPAMQGMDAAALEEADGDESLRYFCHLDFHELFSPRCKSCTTPIEGEVVVACGAEWHVGHFFCAQCGDPFDAEKPFIEQDDYAWCVGCHTSRFSPKCKKCKKPVTDLVLNALDADWHSECFCCVECGDQFEDGRFFIRGTSKDPLCVNCEERRLKA